MLVEGLSQSIVFAGSIDSATRKQIVPARNAAFASNNLLFVRGTTLIAQPFDPEGLRTTGDSVPVAERELGDQSVFLPSGFSVSQTGLLVFQASAEFSPLAAESYAFSARLARDHFCPRLSVSLRSRAAWSHRVSAVWILFLSLRLGWLPESSLQNANSALDRRLASGRCGNNGQTFGPSRLQQSIVERHERNRLSELPLQVQAARKLHGVASAQNMAHEQTTRIRGDLRRHLHDRESGHVTLESSQDPIAPPSRERSLSSTTDDAR